MSHFEHWLEALERPSDWITVGFDAGVTRWPDDMRLWPSQRVGLAVVKLSRLSQESCTQLARLRNLHAAQIALWIDQLDASERNQLLGLGFKGLPGPTMAQCFGYDIESYNHTRDWNNPRYWANPERWGKDFW